MAHWGALAPKTKQIINKTLLFGDIIGPLLEAIILRPTHLGQVDKAAQNMWA
jgi:hypothetical protein